MLNSDPISLGRTLREVLWASDCGPAVHEIIARDCILHGRAPFTTGFESGPMAMQLLIDFYRMTFSEIKVTIEHCINQGNLVSVHWSARARHTGELLGIPATGREIETRGVDLLRIENERVAEAWMYWDESGLLCQLIEQEPDGAGTLDFRDLVERLGSPGKADHQGID